ncbi:rhomboid family intramembrane serine protease [Halohasta litorea]|uniref:Rhomboid family intramembrane serine protease n=1 Tax=Halohasta litorea TaxID=869891 RepID=A0ABD6D998_9EURY|nr:rhomboid family intramembrane serine protease [Halohasta litorea]
MIPRMGGPLLFAESVGSVVAGLPLQRLLLVAAALLAVGTLLVVSRPTARLTDPLTDRFVAGLPWGTLLVSGLLVGIFYLVQDGLSTPTNPVVLPFRAWSYFDPVGMLFAGFTHAHIGHLTGNLLGTLAFGSLAEYWFGHHVDRRVETPLQAVWTHPVARAVVIFPAVTILVGTVGTMVALGPVIGFSTAVFAFAGFALVRYPLATIVVGVGQGVLGRLVDALQTPQQVAVAEATYSTPWWASVAVQGHMIGLLIGVLLGLAVLRLRDESPPPALHVWTGVLLFVVSRSLWAIYWYRGNETYVLYRAVGLALVFVLAAILTVSILARHRPLFPARGGDGGWLAEALGSITGREVGLLLVVGVAALVAGPAIPVNLTTADDAALPGDPIEIEGYEVTYGENVPNGQLSVLPGELAGETTQLNTSGVIVRNTDRHIWSTAVPTGELAANGGSNVRIGGLGWDETVRVDRTSWQAVGGGSAYRVSLAHANTSRPVFASGPATAEPVVAGHSVSINATDEGFELGVAPVETGTTENATDADTASDSQNATETDSENATRPENATDDGSEPIVLTNVPNESVRVDGVDLPAPGESVTVGPIRFVNREDRLFAVHEGTVVRVAAKA